MNLKTSTLLVQLFFYEDLLKSNCHTRTQALGQPFCYWHSQVLLFIARFQCVFESYQYVFKTLWLFIHHARHFRRVCKICGKRLSASSCLTIRPSVRMEQLGSHSTDFHEIWCWSIFFLICVQKIQVSLKSDKNKGYFTRRQIHIFYHTSLISS